MPKALQTKEDKKSEAERKELDRFNAQWTVCDKWRKDIFEPEWWDSIDAYNSIREPNPYPFKSDLTMPIIFETIETFLPKMCANMPRYNVSHETKGGQQYLNQLRNRLRHLWYVTRSYLKLIGFCKQGLILGTTTAKIIWREESYKYHRKSLKDKTHGIYENEKEETNRIIYDDPDLILKDLFDIWFQPEIIDINQMRFMFDREIAFAGNLKKKGEYYENLGKINFNKAISSEITQHENQTLYKKRAMDSELQEGLPADAKVELLTRYSRDSEGRLLETVVANRNTIIRNLKPTAIDTNQAPYVVVQNYFDPFCIYGLGEPVKMRPIQDAISDLYNAIYDNVQLLVNQMWVANDFADIKTEHIVGEPGLIVKTHSPKAGDAMSPLQVREIPFSAFKMIDSLRTEIRNLPGNTVQFSGEHEEGMHRTHSGLRLLAQQSVERFSLRQKLLEETGVKRIAEKFIEFDRQHIAQVRDIAIPTKDGAFFEQISPEMYNHFYKVYVVAESMVSMDEDAELKKAISRLEALTPYAEKNNLDLMPLIIDMLEKTKFEDVDSVVRSKNLIQDPKAEQEHWLIINGFKIEPRQNENFADHIDKHNQFLQSTIGMQLQQKMPEKFAEIAVHLQNTIAMQQQVQVQLKTLEGRQPAQQTEQAAGTKTRMENIT